LDADRLADRGEDALGQREVLRREARERVHPFELAAVVAPRLAGNDRAERRWDLAQADQIFGRSDRGEAAALQQRADRAGRRLLDLFGEAQGGFREGGVE